MKIGLVSDIHADIRSFQRALRLFEQHGTDAVICAGDVVEKGDHGDEVASLLRDLNITCVQGNHDENAVRHAALSVPTVEVDNPPLCSSTIDFLAHLPTSVNLREQLSASTDILMTHAIPSRNAGHVFHGEGNHRLSKAFKKDIARARCEIIVVGHTHFPFDIRFHGTRIVNPGACCQLKPRDSHTSGILDLVTGQYEVFDLSNGEPQECLCGDVK